MKAKICARCKQEKPLSEFYNNRWEKDGLTHWCKECAKEQAIKSGAVYRATHQEQKKTYERRYYAENRAEILKRNKQRQLDHPEKIRAESHRRRIKVKIEVLTHYGNGKLACVKCGESRLACLSIDHMDGGGSQHRKGLKRYSGEFLKWLRDNNYPKRYQTLCMNCQFVKREWEREFRNNTTYTNQRPEHNHSSFTTSNVSEASHSNL